MTNDAEAHQRSREVEPRRPLKKPTSARLTVAPTFDYFSDLNLTVEVLSITEPHALLDWLVSSAKNFGEQVYVTEGFMKVLNELIEHVRCVGYLPPLGGELEHMLDTLIVPGNAVRVNEDLVRLVKQILVDVTRFHRHKELHWLVRRFVEISSAKELLSIKVGEHDVRITSSRELRRSHCVQVDVTMERELRY